MTERSAGPYAQRAGQLAEELGLRAYDAVHLAGAEAVRDPEMLMVAGGGDLCAAGRSLQLDVARL